MKNSIFLLLFFAATILLGACNSNRVYDDYQGLPSMRWDKKNKLKFDVEITDATSTYQMGVNMRHHSIMKYGDLVIKIKWKSPSGEEKENNYVMNIRDKDTGKLLGEALGDICDTGMVVDNKMKFEDPGIYVFEISHNMTDEVLNDIIELGLFIEKAK